MADIGFDTAYPMAASLARLKAAAIVGNFGLTREDSRDIEQELLIACWLALPRYSRGRASLRTFVSRIMDRKLMSILRRRLALARGGGFGFSSLSDYDAPAADGTARTNLAIDVERVLAGLPRGTRQVAVALQDASAADVAWMTGRSRTAVYLAIYRMRRAFVSAGIGPLDLVAGGAQ